MSPLKAGMAGAGDIGATPGSAGGGIGCSLNPCWLCLTRSQHPGAFPTWCGAVLVIIRRYWPLSVGSGSGSSLACISGPTRTAAGDRQKKNWAVLVTEFQCLSIFGEYTHN